MRPFLACLFLVAAASRLSAADGPELTRPNAGGPPTPVRVGLYLVDLYEISASDQTFLADVTLLADWVDPRLAVRGGGVSSVPLGEIWNPRLQLANQRGVTAYLPERVEVDASGRVSYRQRWVGRFSTRMDLRDFPLDRQHLHVQIVPLGYSLEEVQLTVNVEQSAGRAADLTLSDWEIGPAKIEVADYAGAFGANLAAAQLRWEAQRHVGYYAVQVILPLVLIVFMGMTAVWVDPSVVVSRISVSMTTMLTLIAYRFSLANAVPNLTYLTRFDYFMLGSTILIFLILLIVAAGAHLVATGRTPLVHRMDRWTRVAFPVLFAIVFSLSWWG